VKVAVFVALLGLFWLMYRRLRTVPNQRLRDLETVRRTPLPRDVQLRAQAVTDDAGRRLSLDEIRNCAKLGEREAALAYELLRHGERLPEA
jgi:hypothetical protein